MERVHPRDVRSVMATRYKIVIGCGVLLCMGLAYFGVTNLSINTSLKRCDIPPIPILAKVHYHAEGGLFAKYLFLKAELSPEQVQAYEASLAGFTMRKIGDSAGMVKIIPITLRLGIDSPLIGPDAPDLIRHNPGTRPEWDILGIRSGRVHTRGDGLPGTQIIVDTERGLVYIYWCYS